MRSMRRLPPATVAVACCQNQVIQRKGFQNNTFPLATTTKLLGKGHTYMIVCRDAAAFQRLKPVEYRTNILSHKIRFSSAHGLHRTQHDSSNDDKFQGATETFCGGRNRVVPQSMRLNVLTQTVGRCTGQKSSICLLTEHQDVISRYSGLR